MRLAILALLLLAAPATAQAAGEETVGQGDAFSVWWNVEDTIERTARATWEIDVPEGATLSYPWTLIAGMETEGDPPDGGVLFRLGTWVDGKRVGPDGNDVCVMDRGVEFPGTHVDGTCHISAAELPPGARHVEVVLESSMSRAPGAEGNGSGRVEGIIGAPELTLASDPPSSTDEPPGNGTASTEPSDTPHGTAGGQDITALGPLSAVAAAWVVARRGHRGNP